MFNNCTFIGHTTTDLTLAYTSAGVAYARGVIAVNEKYNNQETTLFLKFACFNKLAEIANQYCLRGTKVLLNGKLRQGSYTNNEGIKQTTYTLVVSSLELLGNKEIKQEIKQDVKLEKEKLDDIDKEINEELKDIEKYDKDDDTIPF